jgi:hypothetical protein
MVLQAAHNQELPEAQTLKTIEFHDIYTLDRKHNELLDVMLPTQVLRYSFSYSHKLKSPHQRAF